MIGRALPCLVLLALLGACGDEGAARPRTAPAGPPEVQADVVAAHARQFRTDVGERKAGSQEELAAATYITGHLQRAGYVVLLDAVPLADLVRSTNVVARPPSGGDPKVVVAVPYDTAPGVADNSEALGLFLELARALRVRAPDHHVGFVALGAEHAEAVGGRLGSRRFVAELGGAEPDVVVLGGTGPGRGFSARGPLGPALTERAEQAGLDVPPSPLKTTPEDEVWMRSGLDFAVVSAEASPLGSVLLDYLAAEAR